MDDEVRVVTAFHKYLREHGWSVAPKQHPWDVDVHADRDNTRIYAEVKGITSEPGTDVDTAYGQLLRHMTAEDEPATRYALVVPTEALRAAQRVPSWVRQLLRIDIYVVDSGGMVTLVWITTGQTLQRQHSALKAVLIGRRARQLTAVDRGQQRPHPHGDLSYRSVVDAAAFSHGWDSPMPGVQ
ncbi:MAG: hypothetical protein ACRDTD_31340 [Pseudonocardiaceae bacterium]